MASGPIASRSREEPGRVRPRWTGRSSPAPTGRWPGERGKEEPGSARSAAGTCPAPPRGGERPLPSPGSDKQRRREEGEGGRRWGSNKGVDERTVRQDGWDGDSVGRLRMRKEKRDDRKPAEHCYRGCRAYEEGDGDGEGERPLYRSGQDTHHFLALWGCSGGSQDQGAQLHIFWLCTLILKGQGEEPLLDI